MQGEDQHPGGCLLVHCDEPHDDLNRHDDLPDAPPDSAPQHLDEATILAEAQNLDMEKTLEILRSHGTVQVCTCTCIQGCIIQKSIAEQQKPAKQ